MVLGISTWGLVAGCTTFLIVIGLFSFLCYVKGFAAGVMHEVNHWCDAFDNIRAPNWQSLPIDYSKDVATQTEMNKTYVELFKVATEAIGEQLVANRMKLIAKDLGVNV